MFLPYIKGKGYKNMELDRERLSEKGVSLAEKRVFVAHLSKSGIISVIKSKTKQLNQRAVDEEEQLYAGIINEKTRN